MKLLAGIDLPNNFSNAITEFKNNNKHLQGIKWKNANQFHITTLYTGNIPQNEVNNCIELIKKVTITTKCFRFQFQKFDFSPGKNPKMIWAYFNYNESFKKLCNNLADLNLSKMPSRYNPIAHITIAKLKKQHYFYKPYFDISTPQEFIVNQLYIWVNSNNSIRILKIFDFS